MFVNGTREGTTEIIDVPTISVYGKLETTTVENIYSEDDIVIGASVSKKEGTPKPSNQFSGEIDDVSLYDYVIEDNQILAIYEQTKGTYEELEASKLTIEEIIAQMVAEQQQNATSTEPVNATISEPVVVEPVVVEPVVVEPVVVEPVPEPVDLTVTPTLDSEKEAYQITEEIVLDLEYYDEYDVLMQELEELEYALAMITEAEQSLTTVETQLEDPTIQANSANNSLFGFVGMLFNIPTAEATIADEEDRSKIEIAKVKEEIQKLKDKIQTIKASTELDEEELKEAKAQLKQVINQIKKAAGQISKTNLNAAGTSLDKSADDIEEAGDVEPEDLIQNGDWNGSDETITTKVYDPEGNLIELSVEHEKLRDGKFSITLDFDQINKPGVYKIKTTLVVDGKTFVTEDEFAWGVLTINTNKSIFLPNEEAFISMAVLNNTGNMVCDALIL